MATSSPLRTTAETAKQLTTTEGALAQMRYTGNGPQFVKLGGRSVRYRQEDIDAWVESCIRTRTDDQGGHAGAPASPAPSCAPHRGRTAQRRATNVANRSDGSAA